MRLAISARRSRCDEELHEIGSAADDARAGLAEEPLGRALPSIADDPKKGECALPSIFNI